MTELELRKIAEQLWIAIKDEDCVAWIGAGLSTPAGYLGWPETVQQLCDVCCVPPLDLDHQSTQHLMDKAEECKQANPRAYADKLAALFGRTVAKARQAYYPLLRVPFRGYVTTNFDPLLLEAASSIGGFELLAYPHLPPDWLGNKPKKPLYYIHGVARDKDNRPSGDNLILATSDFQHAYGGTVRPLIDTILLYRPVIFIGCNLGEPQIEESFRRVHAIHEELKKSSTTFNIKPRYALLPRRMMVSRGKRSRTPKPDHDREQGEDSRLNASAIEVVRYSHADETHSEIEEILEFLLELAGKPTGISPSKGLPS